MLCASGLVTFRSKKPRLKAVLSLALLMFLNCRVYKPFVFIVIPVDDVNKCCCTFYFQVDLEPQGRLHIRIELKWKSQGTYNLIAFLIYINKCWLVSSFMMLVLRRLEPYVYLILINCPLLLRSITPGYRWYHTVKRNWCDKCSVSRALYVINSKWEGLQHCLLLIYSTEV